MFQIMIFGDIFWVTVSYLMLEGLILRYRDLLLNIAKHRKIKKVFNVFNESYSGDHREIQKGFKLAINEQIFLIS